MQTHGPEWIHTGRLVGHAKTSWNDPSVASGALPTRRCHGPPRAALRAFVSHQACGRNKSDSAPSSGIVRNGRLL